MREVTTSSARSACARLAVSVAVTGLGVALVLAGTVRRRGQPVRRCLGLGALLLFIGAAMLTAEIARPLARVIGAPFVSRSSACRRRLGRENAMRNPSRTAQTATALTIGVALVAGGTIFAASLSAHLSRRARPARPWPGGRRGEQPAAIHAGRRSAGSRSAGGSPAVTALRAASSATSTGTCRPSAASPRRILDASMTRARTAGSLTALSRPGTIAVQKGYAKATT